MLAGPRAPTVRRASTGPRAPTARRMRRHLRRRRHCAADPMYSTHDDGNQHE